MVTIVTYSFGNFKKFFLFSDNHIERNDILYPFQSDKFNGIHIVSAMYGTNCGGLDDTSNLQQACENKHVCTYRIDYRVIGDPCVAVMKAYMAYYTCNDDQKTLMIEIQKEASGHDLFISCEG